MFKVKYFDEEYLVYSVRYDKEIEQTLFLVYEKDKWEWIVSFMCEPVKEGMK